MAWIDYAASGSIFFHAVRFLAKRKRGKSGTNGVEVLVEEEGVVEVQQEEQPGTYTITVTGTSGTRARRASAITLVVN